VKNLYLIGMMGCGKTTCAGLLAHRLGRPALDTDSLLEAETGMTVSEIFAARGEGYFRDLETDLLRRLAETGDRIVACGGGLPLREENRRLLRTSGTVIFLNRNPETIFDSLDVSGRPLAQGGRADFLERFSRREPLYRAAAHIVIGDCPSPEETAAEIIRQLEGTL